VNTHTYTYNTTHQLVGSSLGVALLGFCFLSLLLSCSRLLAVSSQLPSPALPPVLRPPLASTVLLPLVSVAVLLFVPIVLLLFVFVLCVLFVVVLFVVVLFVVVPFVASSSQFLRFLFVVCFSTPFELRHRRVHCLQHGLARPFLAAAALYFSWQSRQPFLCLPRFFWQLSLPLAPLAPRVFPRVGSWFESPPI